MSTSRTEFSRPLAIGVEVSDAMLTVRLTDGRSIAVPIDWYPRLADGLPAERARWVLLGSGQGIHWPDLDEDIGVDALLAGRRSNETPSSLQEWLATRRRQR